jgi:lipoprotein-anchoring transpeptidase ErfK/SrfK
LEGAIMPSFSSLIRLAVMVGALGSAAACDRDYAHRHHKAEPQAKVAASAPAPVAASAAPTPAAITPPPVAATITDTSPVGQAIDQAAFLSPPKPATPGLAYDPVLLRVEVLLDRAGFSPGAIDGKTGSNLQHALAGFADTHGLGANGTLDQGVWNALTGQDAAPAMQTYQITDADEAGPFIGKPPKDYQALAKLPALSYTDPVQELAEKFHMDQALLKALNPGVDFTKAGVTILVAAPRPAPRDLTVARIEVDKTNNQVRAYDADGAILASYPATVGSSERPAPSGVFAVDAVAPHPAYYYDPDRLTFTPKGAAGKLKIAPGPNNPVGLTWIALTIPTYGIHGAPDPTLIGKRQSHGCVRLTNWDAVELGKSVKKGVIVDFVGQEKRTRAKA